MALTLSCRVTCEIGYAIFECRMDSRYNKVRAINVGMLCKAPCDCYIPLISVRAILTVINRVFANAVKKQPSINKKELEIASDDDGATMG